MSYNAVNITDDKATVSDASIHLIVTESICCNKNINVSISNKYICTCPDHIQLTLFHI